MKWGKPKVIKIYEALSAIADERIELLSAEEARVFSSSRGKYYTVRYDSQQKAIMSNDNAAYWQGTLGYPAIAFLLALGILPCPRALIKDLQGIQWKDLNSEFKNDYEKTLGYVKARFSPEKWKELAAAVVHLEKEIEKLDLARLGPQKKPPQGY